MKSRTVFIVAFLFIVGIFVSCNNDVPNRLIGKWKTPDDSGGYILNFSKGSVFEFIYSDSGNTNQTAKGSYSFKIDSSTKESTVFSITFKVTESSNVTLIPKSDLVYTATLFSGDQSLKIEPLSGGNAVLMGIYSKQLN